MAGRVVITHALRTPIGKYLGGLSGMSSADLGVHAVKALLAQSGVAGSDVGELVFGNGRQAGGGPNVARQVLCRSGIAESSTAYTVNMACGSGLKSLLLAADSVRRGEVKIAVAGGTESMSRLPFMLDGFRNGYRLGHAPVVDLMYKDGFDCPMAKKPMGGTAETLAKKHAITRQEQDEFAVASQAKCEAARKAGKFAAEIAPITIDGKAGPTVIAADEHPRDGVTLASMAKLPPVFEKDGSVHAGNSSGITDGAAALLVMGEEEAARRGMKPLAFLGEATAAGVDPATMGIGPVPAVNELLRRRGLKLDQFDLVELNEAFAAQVLACDRELHFPRERLNVNGGSIALGHPIGATGARIVVTLLHEMARRRAARGLATLCISGGMGLAVEFTRV